VESVREVPSRAYQESAKVVTTLNNSTEQPTARSAVRSTRQKPSPTQPALPKPSLVYKRARYFNAEIGIFIGRDPIGYIDGMSLYRGYFVPNKVDPDGQIARPAICATVCIGSYFCWEPIYNACKNRPDPLACAREVIDATPWYGRVACGGATLACLGCIFKYAKPIIKRGTKRIWNKCKNIRCTVRWHTAHHSFGRLGKKCHIELQCWIKGVKAPPRKIQIPIPDQVCPPRNFDLHDFF